MPRNDTEKAEAETRKKHKAEAKELATDEHGISRKKQKQKHGKESRRKDIFATDEHGKTRKQTEAKNFYRKDAKYAKKEKQCLMLLSALRVFAVRMVLCIRTFTARMTKAHNPKSKSANGVVAVGLPHGNRSVFKYARINKQEVHGRKAKNGSSEFTNEVQHYDKVLSLWEKNIDISRWKTVVRLPDFVKAGNHSGKLQQLWIARRRQYRERLGAIPALQ